MSMHMAYEVRVMRPNGWRVEGVFDEEAIAVAAAKKVEARSGKSPVVVIHEVYDAARNHLKSRSIYRSDAARPATSASPMAPTAKKLIRRPPSSVNGGQVRLPRPPRPERPAPPELWPWLAVLAGGFAILTIILSQY